MFNLFGIMGRHIWWLWPFVFTLACHSQICLDLSAFVIVNTFRVISTSQDYVTLSAIKQCASFFYFFSILKKDFWYRLRHLENRCHWKWKKRALWEEISFQSNHQFSENRWWKLPFLRNKIEYFLWTVPPPTVDVPTHCLKGCLASFLHVMPIRHFFLLQIS